MKDNKLSKDIDLLFEIGCLRFVDRSWKQYLNLDIANLSEHHFRVAWIALLLAGKKKIKNTDKIIKMALLHDVAESRTGDLAKMQKKYTERFEKKAVADIFAGTVLEKEFLELYDEYEKRKSIESQIVKDADNLDVDFEMKEQKTRGYNFSKRWESYRAELSKKRFYTKSAKEIWDKLQNTDPHHWHVEGGSA